LIAIVEWRKQKTMSAHKPYTVQIDEYGRSKRVYDNLPTDEELDALTYDPELLEALVWDKVIHGREAYRNADELINYNPDLQYQCSIYEHAMRYSGIISD
jgi:hypothetical protein